MTVTNPGLRGVSNSAIRRTHIIADDLTASGKERIRRPVERNCIDGFILKPNQVGTIGEALDAHEFARANSLLSITSRRSGGVVMDMAVGLQVPFIKNGCPRSGERIGKLNFLLRVKESHPGCHMANIDAPVRF